MTAVFPIFNEFGDRIDYQHRRSSPRNNFSRPNPDRRRHLLMSLFLAAVACLTCSDRYVSAATSNPDDSFLASLAASFRSTRKVQPQSADSIQGDDLNHEKTQTNRDSLPSRQDDPNHSTSLQFFRRQIKENFPYLNNFLEQEENCGSDVVQLVRRQPLQQEETRLSSDNNDISELGWSNSSESLTLDLNETKESGWLDKLARSFVISAGWFTGLQTMASWLSNYQVVDELTSRWLSTESSAAIKTIREILSNAEDHGLVDVIGKYPPADVAASIFALSRLQQAALFYDETRQRKTQQPANEVLSLELLEDLAHYAKFASAAYGWRMDLAFSGRLHFGDSQALLSKTGVSRDDVVSMQWQSRAHRPAYFIVREVKRKRIVLCIRGTWSLRDILTDLCCTAQEFETIGCGGVQHVAHQGMLEAARAVAETAKDTIASELMANPDFSLVVVGHSMGGGVAALLGVLWKEVFAGKVTVYVYGAPCVSPLKPSLADYSVPIVSVVAQGDPMCLLSLGHIADISIAISQICEQKELRQTILAKTLGSLDDMDKEVLFWCSETMESLRQAMNSSRLYPPGRILLLSKFRTAGANINIQESQERKRSGRSETRIAFRTVPPQFFRELAIGPRMFDLSKHAPIRYESLLRRLLHQESITAS